MIVKEKDGKFNFELTTNEERNRVLDCFMNLVFIKNGRKEYLYEVILTGMKLPDSMIDAALESDKLSTIIARNPSISSDTIDKLLAKNDNKINFNLLNSIKDEMTFNEILAKLIDSHYFDNNNCDVWTCITCKLINLDNFKRLYYDYIFNSEFTYRYTYCLVSNHKDDNGLDYDQLSCIYDSIIQMILKEEPKFFTKASFKKSPLYKNRYIYDILESILTCDNCPVYIIEDLATCKYRSEYKKPTIGSIARHIIHTSDRFRI